MITTLSSRALAGPARTARHPDRTERLIWG
jgi:hypothetical protein